MSHEDSDDLQGSTIVDGTEDIATANGIQNSVTADGVEDTAAIDGVQNNGAIHGVQGKAIADGLHPYTKFFKVPQQPTKRRKVSIEPIMDYSESQILTIDDHVEVLESIVEKKFRIAEEKEEKKRQRELTKKDKEISKERKNMEKASARLANDKEAKKKFRKGKKKGDERELDKYLAALDKEAERRCKDLWIKKVLKIHGENFERLVKEGFST